MAELLIAGGASIQADFATAAFHFKQSRCGINWRKKQGMAGHQCIGSGRHKLAEHQCTGQRLAQAGRVTVHKAAAGTSWQSFPNRHDVAHHGGKKEKWFVGLLVGGWLVVGRLVVCWRLVGWWFVVGWWLVGVFVGRYVASQWF